MKCFICKKSITRKLSPSEIKRNGHFFCSKKCYIIFWGNEKKGKKNVNWKGGNLKGICKLCKKDFEYRRGSGKGIFCSKRCHCIFTLSGEKHWQWKGGISKDIDKLRKSWRYNKWRQRVFKRDNWTCKMCGHRSCKSKAHGDKRSDIEAHHIYKFSDYPKLRFKTDNGITLCEKCHKTYGRKKEYAMVFKEILNDYTKNNAKV